MTTKPITRVGLHHAKTHLSELIRRVEAGEEITIMRRGEVVAKIISSQERTEARQLGVLSGQWQLPSPSDLVKPDADLEALFYGEDA